MSAQRPPDFVHQKVWHAGCSTKLEEMQTMPRVFISYSSADIQFLREHIVPVFEKRGIEHWYSEEAVRPGAPFDKQISTALESSDWVVVLASTSSLSSRWVHAEVSWAFERRQNRIVPVKSVSCDLSKLHVGLTAIDPIDFSRDAKVAKQEIEKWADGLVQPLAGCSVAAVMGVRGGVGKGTFVACAAQLIAETCADVAIIDLDVANCGQTRVAMQQYPDNDPSVVTVLEHLAPHSRHFEHLLREDGNPALWDVTPAWLQERRLGRLWLIPAARPDIDLLREDVVANIEVPREPKVAAACDDLVVRVQAQLPRVRFILIDCGAGSNVLYAGAFSRANYGFILTNPDTSRFGEVRLLRSELQRRFPNLDMSRIHNIVNKVTSQRDLTNALEMIRPVPLACIPVDPRIESESNLLGTVEFGVGYNDLFIGVRAALEKALKGSDRSIIPDEVNVRLKPWWRELVWSGEATRIYRSWRGRTKLAAAASLAAISLVAFLSLLISEVIRFRVSDSGGGSTISSWPLCAGLFALMASGWWLAVEVGRFLTLKTIVSIGRDDEAAQMNFLNNFLQRDRAEHPQGLRWPGVSLSWLKGLTRKDANK